MKNSLNMNLIEEIAKEYNLTVDLVVKRLIEWATSNDRNRINFRAFMRKSTPYSNLALVDDTTKAVYLFNSTHEALVKWSKNKDISATEAVNLIINSFFALSNEASESVTKFGTFMSTRVSPKDIENPAKEKDIQ